MSAAIVLDLPDPVTPGIIARITFLGAGQGIETLPVEDLVGDVAVVDAVGRIRAASEPGERLAAVSQLMERIG